MKVHFLEGRMEVIDFWDLRDQMNFLRLATHECIADPDPFLENEDIRICWHTHPSDDYPVPSDDDFKFMKLCQLDYEVIAGKQAYLVIMKDGKEFKMKYVEWDDEK